ncbi:protein SAWADEE HOMEODOMAIN HOMOLOG 1-like isoform X1 [Olea europaea var. sylvestris]|uniref:SAWADEE HOMEODOMAIN HOMOLOG 1-like isoform X1 n=1 Tax=Olea europaea subsp. europaea TaxID=158383 RepID=A0A8S0QFH6_OLEEU|nr:protein SAWADEE HOMEODOMAIN HOMOLOG 1-like isoform X1 [Olea europaea var. sylvestris]CAA2966088.1 SAWADEE HOMEODOMAIN HOMOLOG 1-like isoform X1 [Olea europaea subsp. europaea]
MDLRPRQRQSFSGFTQAEVEKMEHLHKESSEQSLNEEFYKKLARLFNRSSGRAGKPVVKWTEVQSWFEDRQRLGPSRETSRVATETAQIPEGGDDQDRRLEFEALSSKDGAWYDVETFLSHRLLSSGEVESLVRYVGLGAEEDEWVNVRNCVRERSVPLEDSECQKVKVGDLVVCFQERRDQARYYDAHVIEIRRRLHDIRGCRCIFMIQYDHDKIEEEVRLRRLCCRPSMLVESEED